MAERTESIKKHHRRQPSIGGAFTPLREGSLFEYFLVVGIPPNKNNIEIKEEEINGRYLNNNDDINQSNKQDNSISKEGDVIKNNIEIIPSSSSQVQILFKFPVDKTPDFEVVPFCYILEDPGEKSNTTKHLVRRGSMSEFHSAIYGSLQLLEKAENSFLFLLLHNENVYYGISVINKELLQRWPSFINSEEILSLEVLKQSAITKRVYCFISRFPFFKLHFSVLYSILARERLYTLENIDGKIENNKQNKLLKENEVLSILKNYYSQPVPAAGNSLIFQLPGELHSLTFICPEENEDKLLADWCLPVMFRLFKPEKILLLFSAAMLEKHIVIVCNNAGVVSSIVLSLIPLLKPYIWQGPLIPILPSDLFEYLQAPIPYIVGVLYLPESIEKIVDALIIKVGQKEDEIILPKSKIFDLPKQKNLLENIKSYHSTMFPPLPKNNHLKDARYHDPYKTTNEQLSIVQKIMQEFSKYHKTLQDIITPFIYSEKLKSNEKLVDEIKLLESVSKKDRDFIKSFVSSQQFTVYLERLKNEEDFEEKKLKKNLESNTQQQIEELEKNKKEIEIKIQELKQNLMETEYSKKIKKNTKGNISLIAASLEHLKKSYSKI